MTGSMLFPSLAVMGCILLAQRRLPEAFERAMRDRSDELGWLILGVISLVAILLVTVGFR